jgi:hypothetical protein
MPPINPTTGVGRVKLECAETVAVLAKCAQGFIENSRRALIRPSYLKDGIVGDSAKKS